jgi:hypothetical protein
MQSTGTYSFVVLFLAGCAATTTTASPNSDLAQNPTAPPPKTAVADPKKPETQPPTCPNGTRPAADGLIDDFEAAKPVALGGRTLAWWAGAAPNGKITTPGAKFAPSDGGPPGSKKALRFAGKAAFEDSWGAATSVAFVPAGFYDASKYAGIAFKIKSEKPNANVRLKIPDAASHPDGGQCTKECWNAFGKELIVGTEWQEVVLMWSELTQQPDWGVPRPPAITPSKLKDAEWTIYPGAEFDFWLDDIHFLECK